MFPVLLISVAKESLYPFFYRLAQVWARIILYGMGFWPKVKRYQKIEKGKSYMFISNHTSIADIMLMLHTVNNPFVFVGKKELAKIPIFGFFYKRTCILVDRSNTRSRHAVYKSAQERLDRGLSICIFPEGGVPDDKTIVLDRFKDGAFRLAINQKTPIVPLVFYDNKERFSYTFFSGSPGQMRVDVLPFIETTSPNLDRKVIIKEAYDLIYNKLITNKNKK